MPKARRSRGILPGIEPRRGLLYGIKHGGYSTTAVLPGEDQVAFDESHRALIREFEPNGELERAIVADIARLMWRKQNLATFRKAELARTRYKEIEGFYRGILEFDIDKERKRSARHLDDSVKKAAGEQAENELGPSYSLAQLGELVTFEQHLKELLVEERLDNLIDRCLKRLLYIRGLKSISSAPPPRIVGRTPTSGEGG